MRKSAWYLGGRKRLRKRTKRGQTGGAIPFGLIASAAAPFVGEIAKPLLKKCLVREGGEDDETKYTAKTTYGNTQRIRLPNE